MDSAPMSIIYIVVHKDSRILMDLLAYRGNCDSCNLAAERGLTRGC